MPAEIKEGGLAAPWRTKKNEPEISSDPFRTMIEDANGYQPLTILTSAMRNTINANVPNPSAK